MWDKTPSYPTASLHTHAENAVNQSGVNCVGSNRGFSPIRREKYRNYFSFPHRSNNKMNASLYRSHRFLSLLFAFLLAPVPALGQRLHPRLKEAKPDAEKSVISRLVILPAQVSLVKD